MTCLLRFMRSFLSFVRGAKRSSTLPAEPAYNPASLLRGARMPSKLDSIGNIKRAGERIQ